VKRILKIAGLSLGSLLILVLAAAACLAATETGARGVLPRMLPASGTIVSIEGKPIGPLVVPDRRVNSASLAVAVDRVELRCDRPLPLQADGEDLGDVESVVFEASRDAISVVV